MFICEKCQDDFNIPFWPFLQSYGPCEMCGKAAMCADVPHVPNETKDEKRKESK